MRGVATNKMLPMPCNVVSNRHGMVVWDDGSCTRINIDL